MNAQNGKHIYASEEDWKALRALVSHELKERAGGVSAQYLRTLQAELRRAHVLSEREMPRDVVALGRRVEVEDFDIGRTLIVMPVWPDEAGGDGRVSVLSPIGMALFGYRAGDRVDWGPVDRLIRFKIERVFQDRVRPPRTKERSIA